MAIFLQSIWERFLKSRRLGLVNPVKGETRVIHTLITHVSSGGYFTCCGLINCYYTLGPPLLPIKMNNMLSRDNCSSGARKCNVFSITDSGHLCRSCSRCKKSVRTGWKPILLLKALYWQCLN